MGSVVKPVSLPAYLRDYLASVQEARSGFEAAMKQPAMWDDPRVPQLRNAMNAMFDISIEHIREVHQRLEQTQELERQLPSMAEKAGFDAAIRHMSVLTSRRILFAAAMIGLGTVAGIGGVLTTDYIMTRSIVQIRPTCVDQPDGSQVCTLVIPPAAPPTQR